MTALSCSCTAGELQIYHSQQQPASQTHLLLGGRKKEMHKETKKKMQNRVISKAWLLVKDAWFWGVCKSNGTEVGEGIGGWRRRGRGGINHYWRTPPSVLHPDGPSTPDINHNSSTIDPLSSMLRKSLLLLLIFLFSLCLPYQHLHPPPPRQPSTITSAKSLGNETDIIFINFTRTWRCTFQPPAPPFQCMRSKCGKNPELMI